MRSFYIEDKNTHHAYMGLAPHDERDCRPMDYYRYVYAHAHAEMLKYIATKTGDNIAGNDKFLHLIALRQTDELICKILNEGRPNKNLIKLLDDITLSKRKQEQLLRGLKMSDRDILWWNLLSHRRGFLMDILHIEVLPNAFDEKLKPAICVEEQGKIIHVGETNMTCGEMRAMMRQRKVIQLRIYHKNDVFHCFYFTFRGLAGKESGEFGSQPHYHYVSNKWNYTRENLIDMISKGLLPDSKVHIIIDRNK